MTMFGGFSHAHFGGNFQHGFYGDFHYDHHGYNHFHHGYGVSCENNWNAGNFYPAYANTFTSFSNFAGYGGYNAYPGYNSYGCNESGESGYSQNAWQNSQPFQAANGTIGNQTVGLTTDGTYYDNYATQMGNGYVCNQGVAYAQDGTTNYYADVMDANGNVVPGYEWNSDGQS